MPFEVDFHEQFHVILTLNILTYSFLNKTLFYGPFFIKPQIVLLFSCNQLPKLFNKHTKLWSLLLFERISYPYLDLCRSMEMYFAALCKGIYFNITVNCDCTLSGTVYISVNSLTYAAKRFYLNMNECLHPVL